jgi:hypothetical protein
MTRALDHLAMAVCALIALPLVICGGALLALAGIAFAPVVAMDERGQS